MSAIAAPLAVVILAAGQGTRMKSAQAKVLHDLAGRPMLGHPLAVAEALGAERLLVVVGRDAEAVTGAFAGRAEFVTQAEQRGTGHAVQQCEPALRDFGGDVLVLYADVPLLRSATLERLRVLKRERDAALAMLTTTLPLPGIVVRDAAGGVVRIVETPDASPEELSIGEYNTGVYLLSGELLWKLLARLDDANAQGELYLTDVVEQAVAEGSGVVAHRMEDPEEALGVNTRSELARAAAALRRRKAEALMEAGVTLVDPQATWIDVDVEVGRDTRIEPGVQISGASRLGERVHVKAHSVIEASTLEDEVAIGPSAHLRPGTHLGRGARIGNYVEVKNSRLGAGTKADHLAYIGDADVGEDASFGCGSIVVNYDGTAKHRTVVGDRAFVGCNANLIAPLELEADSYVAAGSTVTKDVPARSLAVARAKQRNIDGWVDRRGTKKQRKATDPEEGKNRKPDDA